MVMPYLRVYMSILISMAQSFDSLYNTLIALSVSACTCSSCEPIQGYTDLCVVSVVFSAQNLV